MDMNNSCRFYNLRAGRFYAGSVVLICTNSGKTKKHVGEQAAICEKVEREKEKKTPVSGCLLARSILRLIIHSILLEFASVFLAPGAMRRA